MLDKLTAIVTPLVGDYPWAVFLLVWLLWVGGTVWEHRMHRNKQITGVWLIFLFGLLAFVVSTIQALGVARWFVPIGVLLIGLFFTNHVLRNEPDKK